MTRAVLMFCPQFRPMVGGAERQAEKLGKALIAAGVDLTILTPRIDPSSSTAETIEGLPVRRFDLSDLAKRFPRVRGLGPFNAFWVGGQIAWHVWRAAREVDVVHCHIGSLETVAAAMGARLRGVPVICKAAMADSKSDLGEAARSGIMGRLVALMGKYAFHRWVATTQAVREALLRAGVADERIVVIPNGVGEAESPPCRTNNRIRQFLYLGRLSTNTERDIPGLIQAFDRLADELGDIELALVGSGNLLQATRALASVAKSANRIRVPGQGDPAEWLSWADCFVLPSRREGLSNALLEAMAAGLPCIANDIPPNREVLADGRCGLLVPVGDTSALFLAMKTVSSNSTLVDDLTTSAKSRVNQKYSISIVTKAYASLYQQLVSH